MRFRNGGNETVMPLYGRKQSCEVKVRRIQDFFFLLKNIERPILYTLGKILGRSIPLDRSSPRRSIIPRMHQEDVYLGYIQDLNTSSVGSLDHAINQFLG
jgi:hypothetical protein